MPRRTFRLAFLFAALLLYPALIFAATACGAWQWANPVPQGNTLNSVTYANGLWVAVGDYGTIITSPDGVNWTIRNSSVTNDLKDAAWGDGKWVVVGYQDTILTSTDGVSWTLAYPGVPTTNFEAVAYGASVFVAAGTNSGSKIVTSEDGIHWTQRVSGGFSDILWAGGRFIGVNGAVFVSYDGITWTILAYWGPWNLAWSGTVYVGVGGGVGVSFSEDLVNWTPIIFSDSYEIYGICWGNGLFVAVGRYWNGWEWVYVAETSPDGVAWEEHVLDAPDTPTAVAWGGDKFVAAGWSGCLLRSPDGSSWSSTFSTVSANTLNGVIWGGDQFVAVGDAGMVLTSPDGWAWTQRTSGTQGYLRDVVWSGTCYVAVGSSGTIVTSSDGVAWVSRLSGTEQSLAGVTFANGQFVAVGDRVILTSPDGVVWAHQSVALPSRLRKVIWGNSQYLAVGDEVVASSPDGIHWATQSLSEGANLYGVLWDGDRYVACGSQLAGPDAYVDLILMSPDGWSWTPHYPGNCGRPVCELYGITRRPDGRLVAAGTYGHVSSSADGVTWLLEPTGTRQLGLQSVASNAEAVVAAGASGTILRQSCGSFPPLPGDCDGDGTVSIGEVQKAINMFLGLEPPGCNVDCDGDGTVSIGEVQKVINAFLGLPASC